VTFVGELGWELHIEAAHAITVYDLLVEAGEPLGMRHAGYRAIESLRLEKGYRIWGADITPDTTPLEAGLGFAVKLKTDIEFCGREALEKQRGHLTRRLLCFTVDDPSVVLLGRETIYRDGERVGWLTSGGFGHTIQKPIGYGYVRDENGVDLKTLDRHRFQLEVAGTLVDCKAGSRV